MAEPPEGALRFEIDVRLAEEQQHDDDQDLDDVVGQRVDHPGGDSRHSRQALALEEADAERHARDARGHGQVQVAGGELLHVDGEERKARRDRTEHGDRLGQARQLRDDERGHDPAPLGVLQVRPDLRPVDLAEAGVDGRRRQEQERDLDDRPPGHALELDQLGDVGSDRLGELLPELVDVDARGLHALAERGRERRRLEVREQRRAVVGAERLDGGRDRAVGAGDGRGGRQ